MQIVPFRLSPRQSNLTSGIGVTYSQDKAVSPELGTATFHKHASPFPCKQISTCSSRAASSDRAQPGVRVQCVQATRHLWYCDRAVGDQLALSRSFVLVIGDGAGYSLSDLFMALVAGLFSDAVFRKTLLNLGMHRPSHNGWVPFWHAVTVDREGRCSLTEWIHLLLSYEHHFTAQERHQRAQSSLYVLNLVSREYVM